MKNKSFKALVAEEYEANKFRRGIKQRRISDLPDGEVLIEVFYSALNYKDALSTHGHKGITRQYPHTPGVDASGIVAESTSDKFAIGDEVLVTGYDMGMNTDGGFGQYIRVPAGWVVLLPENLSLRQSMIYGTAGFTAGLCLHEILRNGITPDSGEVVVTGATGGVGCLAVAMLSKIGFDVTASTGKPDKADFLMEIGASRVVSREAVNDDSPKPMLPQRWAAAIDNAGGSTLSALIKSTKRHGVVTSVGNVAGDKFQSSIYPFILRGVMLIGIDSASRPMDIRLKIWDRIANEWRIDNPEILTKEVNLEGLDDEIELILKGGQTGKILVNMKG